MKLPYFDQKGYFLIFLSILFIISLFKFPDYAPYALAFSLILSTILAVQYFRIRPEQSLADYALRYNMLCHSCGWEWMSNTRLGIAPQKCPNCRDSKNIEVIGWRKIRKRDAKNKNLRYYIQPK